MTAEDPTDQPAAGLLDRIGRVPFAVGVASFLAMLGLAAVGIGRSFGYDEGVTYVSFINGGSVRRALTTQIVFNNHPFFSATQAVGWRLGLVGETGQRLGPALAGATTVGLVAWFSTKRVGWIGGAAAAAFLGLNVMYLDYVRQLRGYALAGLAGLAGLAVLLAALCIRQSWYDHRRRWLLAQGGCMVVAVTTHTFTAVVLLSLAVAALVLGRVEGRHLVTWGLAAIGALAILAPTLDDTLDAADARGNRYLSQFPERLFRSLTSEHLLVALLLTVVIAVGAWQLTRADRRRAAALLAGGAVLVGTVLLMWQVVQPFDLYPRFFYSVIPFLAILVGFAVGRLPRPAGLAVFAATVALLVSPAVDRLGVESPIREAAGYAERSRESGLQVCGYGAEAMFAYTEPMPLTTGLAGYEGCDVFISVLGLDPRARELAREHYSGVESLGRGTFVWADEETLVVIRPPR